MNRFLRKKYALLGLDKEIAKKKSPILEGLKRIITAPALKYILFGVLLMVIGYVSTNVYTKIYSWQSALATTFAYAIAAIGFCLLMGYSGLASLGTGGFIGIGTYAVHFVMAESGMNFIVAVLVAIAISVVIGLIVGFISLRIEGIYLCILTLALSEILRNFYIAIKSTVSISTLMSKNKILIITEPIKRTERLYLVAICLVVIMILTHNLINSPTGRAMLAMKNSTAAAQAMGISLMKYRLLAFVLCTAYAAFAGTLIMITMLTVDATEANGVYSLLTSLNILAAVIIGGYKSIWGAVFGAFVMYGMETVLFQNIPFFAENPVVITLISGVLVILVVMFYPGGLAQLLMELKGKIKKLRIKIREAKYGKDLG